MTKEDHNASWCNMCILVCHSRLSAKREATSLFSDLMRRRTASSVQIGTTSTLDSERGEPMTAKSCLTELAGNACHEND